MFQPLLIHGKKPAKIRENDKERTEIILNAGYRVIEQCECQWNQLEETEPEKKRVCEKTWLSTTNIFNVGDFSQCSLERKSPWNS